MSHKTMIVVRLLLIKTKKQKTILKTKQESEDAFVAGVHKL